MLLCLCPANFRGGGPGGTLLAQGAGAGSPAVSGPSQCQAGLQPELEGVKDSCAQSLHTASPALSPYQYKWHHLELAQFSEPNLCFFKPKLSSK